MIGIICAMQLEADGIIALAESIETEEIYGMTFRRGTLGGQDVTVVVCGEGKVNAAMCATVLIDRYHPKVVEHDMNMRALGYKQGEVCLPSGTVTFFECDKNIATRLASICKTLHDTRTAQGIIASGDVFISDRRKRLRINDRFGAVACEMEGAAIGHVCHRCGVPFAVIRAISDDLDENKGVDFVKFCRLAADKTVAVMKDFFAADNA